MLWCCVVGVCGYCVSSVCLCGCCCEWGRVLRCFNSRKSILCGNITSLFLSFFLSFYVSLTRCMSGCRCDVSGGPRLVQGMKKLHGCKTGEAKITDGGNLTASWVVCKKEEEGERKKEKESE